MHAPTISVIIPTYNHERYVREAIESVLTQQDVVLEVVVIDDASRDGTWDVIQGLGDPRIVARRHADNQGAHRTLNEGLALARGDYLAILNSDDRFRPGRLARLVAALGDQPRLAFSDVAFMDSEGRPATAHERALDYADARRLALDMPPAAWLLNSNLAITTSNFVFPRSLYEQIGGFEDLRYTHDWEWALRASAEHPPLWVREALVDYRVHPTNTLAEDDVWRHVHENAYIQSRALRSSLNGLDSRQACTALFRNSSLHPAATLAFLLFDRQSATAPDALQSLIRPQDGRWFLPDLAETCGLDPSIFLSARHLSERQHALAAQTALIDERWATIQQMNGLVEEKNASIAAQASLIEERAATIAQMDTEIARRDEAIAAQGHLLEERYAAMEAQGRLLEERYSAMEAMGLTISSQQDRIDRLERTPWNRFMRLLARIGGSRKGSTR